MNVATYPASSNIKAILTDNDNDTEYSLAVLFNNNHLYGYIDVPRDVIEQLLESTTVGTTFSTLIKKGGYAYKKLA